VLEQFHKQDCTSCVTLRTLFSSQRRLSDTGVLESLYSVEPRNKTGSILASIAKLLTMMPDKDDPTNTDAEAEAEAEVESTPRSARGSSDRGSGRRASALNRGLGITAVIILILTSQLFAYSLNASREEPGSATISAPEQAASEQAVLKLSAAANQFWQLNKKYPLELEQITRFIIPSDRTSLGKAQVRLTPSVDRQQLIIYGLPESVLLDPPESFRLDKEFLPEDLGLETLLSQGETREISFAIDR